MIARADAATAESSGRLAASGEPSTFHGLFEAQASRTPEAPALESPEEHLSYRELDARANQLARQLMGHGVGVEDRVVLLLERSIDAVVALIGVLKAGAAYVPVDPGYPPERVEYMLADSEPAHVITRETLAAGLPAGTTVTCLDRDAASLASRRPDSPGVAVELEHLAYVIYTSGSTGRPKGVQITHRGALGLLRGQRQWFELGPEDRVLQFSSLSFDASVWEIWMALHSGAALYVPSEARRRYRLRNVLEESGVTHAVLVPSALATVPAPGPASLRSLVLGGEVCSPGIARAYSEGRRFFNAYGPTEITICASVERVVRVGEDTVRVPIGHAFGDARPYVLDSTLEPVSPGTTGELYIGGHGLARGYLGRPALTAERFLPDPFAPEPGARMYRTGDLVFENPEGALEFVGRSDSQVKVRGFRIELGEIEATLQAHPRVQAAAVVVEPGEGGEPELVGYVSLDEPGSVTIDDLQALLAQKLPDYMALKRLAELDEMPLTPIGKIDREALGRSRGGAPKPGVAPLDPGRPEAAGAEAAGAEVGWRVVVNDEGEHALWPDGHRLPPGWEAVGPTASKAEGLERIARLWTDMRPRRLRPGPG